MFRRRYRTNRGGLAIVILIVLAVLFSGGLSSLFVFGNVGDKGKIIDTEYSSSKGVEYDNSSSIAIEKSNSSTDNGCSFPANSDSEENQHIDENIVSPNDTNTQCVIPSVDTTFSGRVTGNKKVVFTYTASVTGKHWLELKDYYSTDSFEAECTDHYGKSICYKGFHNYNNSGTDFDLEAGKTYNITVTDMYSNNKNGSFTLVVCAPDPVTVIDTSKLFLQYEIRFPNQVIEYDFTPTQSATYEIEIVESTRNLRLEEFGFYDSKYNKDVGSHGYLIESNNKPTAELIAGTKYRLRFYNGSDNTGTIVFAIKQV